MYRRNDEWTFKDTMKAATIAIVLPGALAAMAYRIHEDRKIEKAMENAPFCEYTVLPGDRARNVVARRIRGTELILDDMMCITELKNPGVNIDKLRPYQRINVPCGQ